MPSPPSVGSATEFRASLRDERRGLIARVTGPVLEVRRKSAAIAAARVLGADAVALALSPDGRQALVVAHDGEVVILNVSTPEITPLLDWRLPPGASPAGVAWEEQPLVQGSDGRVWTVPHCVECDDDDSILRAVAMRVSSCMTERQLTFI